MADRPRIWLLIGDKPGDNAQARALAEALSWPYEVRQVFPKPEWVLGKPRFEPGLDHLDPVRSAVLEPPWPDLILTVGRRPSMAALWVQDRSAGCAQIVLLGRPKRWAHRFALIVAPRQFKIPPRDNLIQLDLPLLRVDRAAVAAAADAWRERLSGLAPPLTAILIGGATKPFRFDSAAAATLMDELQRIRARDGGTLYISTSRRTRPDVVESLEGALPRGAILYRWSPQTAADNPYLALLAHADRFVVTGDSVSMMVEVASMGRPLAIYALPMGASVVDRARALAAQLPVPGIVTHALHRLGIAGYSRDLGEISRLLIERGLAVPLGAPFRSSATALEDELAPVVARIRDLVTRAAVA
jgi:mitochondrial fission protein ELM1